VPDERVYSFKRNGCLYTVYVENNMPPPPLSKEIPPGFFLRKTRKIEECTWKPAIED
jgi:hypothetical protein